MAFHNQTGELGEQLANQFLITKGFNIVCCNWRYKHWEVDIIATKNKVLHFIEVKTRRSEKYGNPEDGVSKSKLKNLIDAAEEYTIQHPEWKWICFDILAITLNTGCPPEYYLIEDVYL